MSLNIVFTLLSFLILFQFSASGQSDKIQKVAVLPFTVGGELSAKEGGTLTQWFIDALTNTKKYDVLERAKMNEILKEQDFSLTDMCNSAECAVEIGKLLTAEKIVQGDVGKFGETYTIILKIVDVSTSKIDKSVKDSYKGSKDGLLDVINVMAQKLAGTYKVKNNYTWYYVGGVLVAGGGAAALLLGGKKTTSVGLPFPPDPPN
jgi:hypothetical protein